MNAAVAVETNYLEFDEPSTRLTSRIDLNRDKTRYVACLGNHLETTDARQLTGIGGWAGGVYIGHSEVGGCPTMKRTHYMVLRGMFTPLETTAISKKADHRENEAHRESYLDGPGVPAGTRGYTVYAGDDLTYLQSDRYRPMGMVELTPLMGVDWASELRISLQNFFFPEWQLWQKGEGKPPILLADWEDLVKLARGKSQYESHEMISEELLESARLFKDYALTQIEKNRQAIQSMRSADHGGMRVGWHNKCRMFAEQLGIVLEDEKTLAPTASADTTGLVTELREDRKIREQELQMQKELNAALIAKITGEKIEIPAAKVDVEPPISPVVIDLADSVSTGIYSPDNREFQEKVPVFTELDDIPVSGDKEDELILAPIEEAKTLTHGCSELNGRGEPCKGKTYLGDTKCTFHGGNRRPID